MVNAWSAWNWSNTDQSCGDASRHRGITPAEPGGRSCEAQFGLDFANEIRTEPCPGIIHKYIYENNDHM